MRDIGWFLTPPIPRIPGTFQSNSVTPTVKYIAVTDEGSRLLIRTNMGFIINRAMYGKHLYINLDSFFFKLVRDFMLLPTISVFRIWIWRLWIVHNSFFTYQVYINLAELVQSDWFLNSSEILYLHLVCYFCRFITVSPVLISLIPCNNLWKGHKILRNMTW